MTNNQTIDCVPRALLEVFANSSGKTLAQINGAIQELRALLVAKPETVVGHNPACRAVDDYKPGDCSHGCKPPAQPQPVARIDGMYGDPEAFAEREIRALCDVNKLKIGTLLYAEQPAPVSVATPERKTVLVGVLSESNTHNQGWNACLDELKRLNPSL